MSLASLTLRKLFPAAKNPSPLLSNTSFLYQAISSICQIPTSLNSSVGDSISLIFAESSDDFSYLVGNQAKNADRIYPLAPELPLATSMKIVPHLAVQVTLLPNSGICITCTDSHSITDANVVIGFLKAWGSAYRNRGDEELVATSSVPFLDRSALIKDRQVLDAVISKEPQSINFKLSPAVMLAATLARVSFIICQADIEKLKKLVGSKSGGALASAYVWICKLKAMKSVGEEMDDVEQVYFILSLDCRAHFDPPIPSTYMGNYIAPCIARSSHGQLLGPEGLSIAAELIGDAYDKRVGEKRDC